jgi:hypothetical protein
MVLDGTISFPDSINMRRLLDEDHADLKRLVLAIVRRVQLKIASWASTRSRQRKPPRIIRTSMRRTANGSFRIVVMPAPIFSAEKFAALRNLPWLRDALENPSPGPRASARLIPPAPPRSFSRPRAPTSSCRIPPHISADRIIPVVSEDDPA